MSESRELITVYTNDLRNGTAIPRAQAHAQGLHHDSVHVIVYGLLEGIPVVWLQKRAMSKKLFPGMWDFAATGHPSAGEPAKKAALRELREETGLNASPKALVALETTRQAIWRPDGGLDDETAWSWALRVDGDPALEPADGECEYFAAMPIIHMDLLINHRIPGMALGAGWKPEIVRPEDSCISRASGRDDEWASFMERCGKELLG